MKQAVQALVSVFTFFLLISNVQVKGQSEESALITQRQSNLERMISIYDSLKYKRNKNPCEPNLIFIRRKFLEEGFVDNGEDPVRLVDDNLISPYAFRKEIKKTFTTTVIGYDDASKVSRYASLDVSQKPAFSFSPFTWESNPKTSYYNNIWGVTFSGKLTDASIFKLKDFRDLKAGAYFVRILNLTNYKPTEPALNLRDRYLCNITPDVDKIIEDYRVKYRALCKQGCLDEKSKESKYTALGEKFIEEVTDVEIAGSEEHWASKNFFWLRGDASIGMDKISYLSKDSLDVRSYRPVDEKFFTATLKGSANYFHQKGQKKGSFLLSLWASINRKHTFSEVLKPDDFQTYHAINDTINQLLKTNPVFIIDRAKIQSGLEFDFGGRIVRMFSFKENRLVGLSFSFTRKGLVGEADFPSLFVTEAGLVFPFMKADGKSTFNLEIFYKSDVYSDFTAPNDRFLGFRFNVPIGS